MVDEAGTLTAADVAAHRTSESCWVVIKGVAWDVTSFLSAHPGGAASILKHAGRDATRVYASIHPPGTIEKTLPPEACVGRVAAPASADGTRGASVPGPLEPPSEEADISAVGAVSQRAFAPPALRTLLNLHDFEVLAEQVLAREAWAYYKYGAEDEATVRENAAVWARVWFRPRVLVDVVRVDSRCKILGVPSSAPVYVSATAWGTLGHPDGEVAITRAAGRAGMPQMVSTLASCSFDQCAAARVRPSQPLFFQLYVSVDHNETLETLRMAEANGAKAIFVTVDTAQSGRREGQIRVQIEGQEDDEEDEDDEDDEDEEEEDDEADEGGGSLGVGAFDAGLNWDTIAWLRTQTSLPLVLKGVGRWEDAVKAAEAGLAGVVFSNHGGRQLSYARSGLEVLAESVPKLQERGLVSQHPRDPLPDGRLFSLFCDGGVRRGSDVLKALALGATAVGIGRPVLYALASHGERGVHKALNLLREEVHLCQRLLGAPTLDTVTPDLVDASSVSSHGTVVPPGKLALAKL